MSLMSGPEPTPGPTWLTSGEPERDLRLFLGGLLKQAWGLFCLNRLDEAETTALALTDRLAPLTSWNPSAVRNAAETQLLLAATKTVLGCIAEQRERNHDAEDLFANAVALYDQWTELPNAPGLIGQDYRFYGVGLDRVGRKEQAVTALEQALRLGDITVETYRLLADIYRVMGEDEHDPAKLGRGEEYIRKALEMSPSSPTSHELLGKILEALDRRDEAVDAYLQSVQALSTSIGQRLPDALRTLDRASALAPEDSRVAILRGIMLAAQGRHVEALSALEPAVRRSPPDVWALVITGGILRAGGRHEESKRILRQAVEYEPGLVPAWIDLAQTLQVLGDREGEIGALNRALELAPEHVDALVLRGKALIELTKFDKAIADLRRAAQLSPQLLWVHSELAEALRLAGRFEEALPVLGRALEMKRDDPHILGIRGQVLRALGRLEEGAADLRRAVETKPDLIWAQIVLAEILAEAGQHSAALDSLEEALKKFPNEYSLLKKKVILLNSQDRDSKVMLTVLHALDINPDIVWAHIELALVLCRMDFTDEAMESVRRAFSLEPKDTGTLVEALTVKAKVSCAVGNYQMAIDTLDETLEHAPTNAGLHGVRGWALENLDPPNALGASQAYEKALEYDPNNPWWHKGRGNALRFLDDDENAKTEYHWVLDWAKELKQRPKPEVLSLIGWCHYSLGHYDDAVDLISKALTLKPSLVSDQFDFALALMCRGNQVFGLREYRKAVEMSGYKPVSRRCGLFRVALRDLRFAAKKGLPPGPQVAEADELLCKSLEEVREIVAIDYQQSVERAIELNVPVDFAFFHLTQFENYPKFLNQVNRVRRLDGGFLRWNATIQNKTETWDVKILEQTPFSRISWQSETPNGHSCALTLFPANGGTRLRVRLAFNDMKRLFYPPDPAGVMQRFLDEALKGFKSQVET